MTKNTYDFIFLGIPNIVRSDVTFIKVIWALFLTISSGFCSFFVYKAICAYIQFDVVTKISVISEMPALMPTITFCSQNAIVTNSSNEFSRNILTYNGINIENTSLFFDTFGNNIPWKLSRSR